MVLREEGEESGRKGGRKTERRLLRLRMGRTEGGRRDGDVEI